MFQDPANTPSNHDGRYKPTLIIHGGAGAISRTNLPPSLYQRYRESLLRYLTDTKGLLDSGTSALDAACHAVSLMEDDPLFNCGKGSVFTSDGKIEMEASVMVASVRSNFDDSHDGAQRGASRQTGAIKRGAAVSLVRNTKHPIMLAKEVLLAADSDGGLGGTSMMHCHLSGESVEKWGWKDKGLERKEDEWFWTKRRWEEHRRGLDPAKGGEKSGDLVDCLTQAENVMLPSQGTVGAVCLDSWGNLAVATSTGGLTNKAPGRIGDTPTIGAGFWAESWDEQSGSSKVSLPDSSFSVSWLQSLIEDAVSRTIASCLPSLSSSHRYKLVNDIDIDSDLKHPSTHRLGPTYPAAYGPRPSLSFRPQPSMSHHALAMSGTGNGDSFLRTNAVRTAAAMCRFSNPKTSLSQAVTAIAGPGGELQHSAGDRWEKTGEGQGGIIGIEVESGSATASVVFDFNCGGLWRAHFERDPETGKEVPKVMVFRDEY